MTELTEAPVHGDWEQHKNFEEELDSRLQVRKMAIEVMSNSSEDDINFFHMQVSELDATWG